jgi:hypothetical protein
MREFSGRQEGREVVMGTNAEGRTVVGRAWRRRADWVSHSWAVGKYGILIGIKSDL